MSCRVLSPPATSYNCTIAFCNEQITLVSGDSRIAPRARLPLHEEETATFRILVVDDFEPWRRATCAALGQHPDLQVVGEATDGMEAIQRAQELKPDLILLDIRLPQLNGIEAAHRIEKLVPEAKVIFVTSNNNRDVVEAALTNGAHGYVLKADGKSELLLVMRAVLRGEKVVSKSLKR